jgi:hypothetical protein
MGVSQHRKRWMHRCLGLGAGVGRAAAPPHPRAPVGVGPGGGAAPPPHHAGTQTETTMHPPLPMLGNAHVFDPPM